MIISKCAVCIFIKKNIISALIANLLLIFYREYIHSHLFNYEDKIVM